MKRHNRVCYEIYRLIKVFNKNIGYVNDYLGFRSSEPFAFTLTVVKGASASTALENPASPDLETVVQRLRLIRVIRI